MIVTRETKARDVEYEHYCVALTLMADKSVAVASIFGGVFSKLEETLTEFASRFQLEMKDVVRIFKDSQLFKLLKTVGFNLYKLLEAIRAFGKLLHGGLLRVFAKIAQTGMIQKLKEKAITVDEFLDEYPQLKKITGIAVGGLLLYVWLSMSFIGSLDYDLDLSDVINAFAGNYSIEKLFTSDAGLMTLTLFGVGAFTGISFPWLGSNAANLTLAVLYTLYKRTGKPSFIAKFGREIERKRL